MVAQPRCLATSGTVTVVLDLLAVGGNRFACVLPAFIEDRAIRTFARSLTEVDSQEMRIYVGESWTRQAAGTDLRLDAGDVIKVTTSDTPPAGQPSFEEICRDQHCWCPADQHPRPFLKPGILPSFRGPPVLRQPTSVPAATAFRSCGTYSWDCHRQSTA